MRTTTLLFFVLATAWLTGQEITVASGRVERIASFQSHYVASRNVDIWLPESYALEKKHAVLYMHDGQMLFDATTTWNKQEWGVDETITQLLKEQLIKDVIVVGIWNTTNRHAEYFPEKPFTYLTTRDLELVHLNLRKNNRIEKELIPQSDNYLKFIVEELKPFIDATYATHTDKTATFIAGSSMGGLISWYALCEYPNVFGGAACLSTHWPGIFEVENNPIPQAFLNYLEAALPNPNENLLYFDYGTATLDALYPSLQKKVDALLLSKKFSSDNWITLPFEGAEHTEKAWRERLNYPLLFLLRH